MFEFPINQACQTASILKNSTTGGLGSSLRSLRSCPQVTSYIDSKGDTGKRKPKSCQKGGPHLEDHPHYNAKSFSQPPAPFPYPTHLPKAVCNEGPHPTCIYYYISQTGSCGPASFFTGKRGPASVPPWSRLGPASRGCVVFPMNCGPASVPPLADAWFF